MMHINFITSSYIRNIWLLIRNKYSMTKNNNKCNNCKVGPSKNVLVIIIIYTCPEI
jgi:hypothetical protein